MFFNRVGYRKYWVIGILKNFMEREIVYLGFSKVRLVLFIFFNIMVNFFDIIYGFGEGG